MYGPETHYEQSAFVFRVQKHVAAELGDRNLRKVLKLRSIYYFRRAGSTLVGQSVSSPFTEGIIDFMIWVVILELWISFDEGPGGHRWSFRCIPDANTRQQK